jgi:hypothetical protein
MLVQASRNLYEPNDVSDTSQPVCSQEREPGEYAESSA